MIEMTDQDRINVNVQRQLDLQNARIEKIDVKLDAFIQEMRDFKTEMRDRDNQRAAETQALRSEMTALRAEMIADIKELRVETVMRDDKLAAAVDSMGKHVRNITIASIVGVGAAVIGIGVMVVGILWK